MLKQAVVLVGGRGSRLGSLTNRIPKPMLDVGGKPFLDYLIGEIARYGITDIVLLCGYQTEVVASHFEGKVTRGARAHCVREASPLGTAGALRHALSVLDDKFLLFNGDSLFDFNYLALVEFAESGEAPANLALRSVAQSHRYGTVLLAGDRVVRFSDRGSSAPGLINGGVYVLSSRLIADLPEGPLSLEQDVLPELAGLGLVRGRAFDGFFLDIGIPEDYERAQTELPAAVTRPAVFMDRDGVLFEDTGHVHRPDQVRWTDGVFETIRRLNDSGYYIFVVTNQAGVARGYYTESDVSAFHGWINGELRRHGAHIDAFYYCPHHPEGAVGAYRIDCDCRKPKPGMILSAAAEWPILWERSFLVGDNQSDLEAATRAGLRGMLFEGGNLAEVVGRAAFETLPVTQPGTASP